MSPDHDTDRRSVLQGRRRADALRNHDLVLAAADALFATSDDPAAVTMDDVARAAGVGKGTLFRAFGDRSGLIRAVWSERYAPLRVALSERHRPFDEATPARDQILALADAILRVKLDNRHLAVAVEQSSAEPFTGSSYGAAHGALVEMLDRDARQRAVASHRAPARWTAHAILGVLRADLIDHLLGAGTSPTTIRRQIRALVVTLTA